MQKTLFAHPEYVILIGVVLFVIIFFSIFYVLYRLWDIRYETYKIKEIESKKTLKEFEFKQEMIPISELCDYINDNKN